MVLRRVVALFTVCLAASPVSAGRVPLACQRLASSISKMKPVWLLDGSVDTFDSPDTHWNAGDAPDGVQRDKDGWHAMNGQVSTPMAADAMAWTVTDLDGDGAKETLVQTSFLQGHGHGMYNLVDLYIFCGVGSSMRLCSQATFISPPLLVSFSENSVVREPIGPHKFPKEVIAYRVRIALVKDGTSHRIAVLHDTLDLHRRPKSGIDIYEWRRNPMKFNLICQLR